MIDYYPEGRLFRTEENRYYISSPERLKEAILSEKILEARVTVCDREHNLIVDLNGIKGIIPRALGAAGISEGNVRDIALISRVNKPVCFKVLSLDKDGSGRTVAMLSRKDAQKSCIEDYISKFKAGDIINASVTHLDSFGCFADIGCGISALMPIDFISVSRISHPKDRFKIGDEIKAVVKSNENGRILLSHKELLGTWEENASLFNVGETVAGMIRSVEKYGIFVELTPNLAGLAEPFSEARPGQTASVYIKSIIPEKMKIKLILVDFSDEDVDYNKIRYFNKGNHIDYWKYSPDKCEKLIESRF